MDPRELGFPPTISKFRDVQLESFEYVLTSLNRFTALGQAPGAGKSGTAFGLAKLFGGRTVILTANLGLQEQYCNEFGARVSNIQGRSNYHCWSGGTCEDGGRLGCSDKEGCPYLRAYRVQQDAEIVVTNYAYWLAVNEKGNGIKPPDTLICDEAGLASEWLSRALDFYVTERECRQAGEAIPRQFGESIDEWVKLGPKLAAAAKSVYIAAKAKVSSLTGVAKERAARELKHAESFVDRSSKLERLAATVDNWVCSKDHKEDGTTWTFECIWPGMYREKLFRNVPRVVLLSATLRPKTLNLLGIRRDEADFKEWPRQFPAANGPVVWVPTARLGSRMGPEDEKRWLDRHEEIVDWGSDRKGLVHTVSYARAKQIAESLRGKNKGRVHLNGAADFNNTNARTAYKNFVGAKEGSVLISPSFSTGWDFKGTTAEFQVISKIPFPDLRSKVNVARHQRDSSYGNYLAAQELVQACGRINRSHDDLGTTLILDDNWAWFERTAAESIPKWFRVRQERILPKPLPKL